MLTLVTVINCCKSKHVSQYLVQCTRILHHATGAAISTIHRSLCWSHFIRPQFLSQNAMSVLNGIGMLSSESAMVKEVNDMILCGA